MCAQSCRAGHIIPITPSKWSQKAIIDLGVRTSIVLPHGVDTSVMHPGLAFHLN
jgi:hypothetical protein